jgi:hypothetical protein
MTGSRNRVQLALLIGACLSASKSWGEEANHWIDEDKIKLSIGTFITDYDSEFSLSSSKLGRGTNLSFEDDLGLEESNTVIRLDGHYRFSAKHRVEFSYFDLSRDGTVVTTRPIIIDDTLFRKGSTLSTTFDYQVLKLAYAYSFWQTEQFDLSASGGLYTFDIDLSVKSDDGKTEGDKGTAPFPMFGLHLDYRLSKDVYLITSFEYFAVHENDLEGELTDGGIYLEYRPYENIGFGLGYNAITIFVEDNGGDDSFDFEYDGLQVYLSWNG